MKRRSKAAGTSAAAGVSEGEQGFWPSYADMMSSVALILFFLMLLSYIQNLVTGNNLKNTQEVLEATKLSLADTLKQVEDTKLEVEDTQKKLILVQVDLDEANEALLAKQNELVLKQSELDEQQALLDTQGEYLAAANDEILEMRGQMQTIAVLRLSILEQIKNSIVNATGDSKKVSIGENGNIILNEGVFFDTGSYDIKPESATALNQLNRVFSSFLSDKDNAKYIDSIVISGHTDDEGTDENNRTLSTSRANSVLNYLLSDPTLSQYSEYFCAAGYGETRPVAPNDTAEGRAQNRRIEISIILKDDTVMDIVDKYLEIEVPEDIQQ